MRISFDFDDTLTEKHFQQLAGILTKSGTEVFIITTRLASFSQDIYQVADLLNIPKENIYFTQGQLKAALVKQLEIDIHFDDDPAEVDAILQNGQLSVLVKLDFLILQRLIQNKDQ